MRKPSFVASLIVLSLIAVLGPSRLAFAAQCQDHDGDGFDNGCCRGSDCNDNDATINAEARDICDNKDNDCNPGSLDGTEESGYACVTGQPGVCSPGTLQCVVDATNPTGKSVQCVASASAGPDVCDCKDNNCNGTLDEGCPDGDGDGYATGCDCNDFNSTIHPGAVDICGDGLDQDCDGNSDDKVPATDGQPSCLEIPPIQMFPGIPLLAQIRVAHDQGVCAVDVVEDDDGVTRTYACQQPSCYVFVPVAYHAGPRRLDVTVRKCTDLECTSCVPAPVVQKTFAATVACQAEFCDPDPMIGTFLDWMRGAGYPECVVGRYLELGQQVDRRVRQKRFLRVRNSHGSDINSAPVAFYDVLQSPISGHTMTHKPMGLNDGDTCVPCDFWPDWCPSTLSPAEKRTNYLFLERLFEKTYGMPLTFTYQTITVDYFHAGQNGSSLLSDEGSVLRLHSDLSFLSQFPPHAIVHYALQTYDGDTVLGYGDTPPSVNVAQVSYEPNDAATQLIRASAVFTHEWGHGWGFRHSVVEDAATTTEAAAFGDSVALDGIMDNSIRGETPLMDPLDPLERYALEPSTGYADAPGFASAYATGVTGTYELPTCGAVDPAILSATLVSTLPFAWVVDLTLRNNGTASVGYVTLGAYDGSVSGTLIVNRTLERLGAGETKIHRVTVGNSGFASQSIVFALDSANRIPESVESNNTISVLLPPCVDGDDDDYAPGCIRCSNVHCPVLDCQDGIQAIHPGAVESPAGSAPCTDGLDNDCDQLIDAADTGCGAPPMPVTQTADGETVPPTSGVISQGTYVTTKVSDDTREALAEGGAGTSLIHTWRFDNVPAGGSHQLLIEGYRNANSDGDDFRFSYFNGPSFDGSTTFIDIAGAVIDYAKIKGADVVRTHDFPAAISGTVFVRIRDTAGGTIANSVFVDYLAIRTNP